MSGDYGAWIGRDETRSERIAPAAVAAMAATLDLEGAPGVGEPLPPAWQWLFFNPIARRSELDVDGHIKRGGFLPPIALPRRMWAGSRIQYVQDLTIGADATRRSKILNVEEKAGKRGSLCFVTVEHTIEADGVTCIVEEQDLVYRDPPPADGAAPALSRHPVEAEVREEIRPDTTLLFRYSALTFNGHRIHYDRAYAQGEEGYPDLVVHGPLTATLLQGFAARTARRRMTRFNFRAVSPLFVGRAFALEAREAEGGALEVWARGPDGDLAMSGAASFS